MEMKEIISSIWTKQIAAEYRNGHISNERGLQANLYRFMREKMPDVSIFVEPITMYYQNGKPKFFSDLVLCEGEKISLIAEIKFVPEGYIKYEDDMEKLKTLAKVKDEECEYNLAINPEDGTWDNNKKYFIADDTEYAFFVIGRHDAEAVYRRRIMVFITADRDFERHFSLFYGRVNPDEQPDFGYE